MTMQNVGTLLVVTVANVSLGSLQTTQFPNVLVATRRQEVMHRPLFVWVRMDIRNDVFLTMSFNLGSGDVVSKHHFSIAAAIARHL